MNAINANATDLVSDPSAVSPEAVFAAQAVLDSLTEDNDSDFGESLDAGEARVRVSQVGRDEYLVDLFTRNDAIGAYVVCYAVAVSDDGARVNFEIEPKGILQ